MFEAARAEPSVITLVVALRLSVPASMRVARANLFARGVR
jgi:hypothetical protein